MFKASLILFVSFLMSPSFSSADLLTVKGIALQAFLDNQRVDQLWLPKQYVEWKTGVTINPTDDEIVALQLPRTSHCSAYVASVAMRLQITLLNPDTSPDGNVLLANHQNAWLNSEAGAKAGWIATTVTDAETIANQGELVIASIAGIDPNQNPGHIAMVVPDAALTADQILVSGPTITQSGSISPTEPNGNAVRTDTVSGFHFHTHGSLIGIQFFHHVIPDGVLPMP